MQTALQAYLEALNAGDAEAIVDLFADDASIEDPVGLGVKKGREALVAFYRNAVNTGARFQLDGPIRASFSNTAAMAISVVVALRGTPVRIDIIEVMNFDEAGKICSMQAIFGRSNIEPL
ncbi:MAG: nuclear transport factor 2 family protein [Gammaproteobacteria bacterium]|nr:nuclear transport factor 2 family protein [Gammaproteobacteria bacterium]